MKRTTLLMVRRILRLFGYNLVHVLKYTGKNDRGWNEYESTNRVIITKKSD